MKNIYLLFLSVLCFKALAQFENPKVNLEAHIISETGQVLSNTSVTAWFRKLKTTNPWDGQDNLVVKGVTDEKGVFAITNQTIGLCGFNVEKVGYYLGRAEFRMNQHQGNDRWMPWPKITELKLRKWESPIPMYAKKFDDVVLPESNHPVGYDLVLGDWVPPNGKGLIKDLVFTFHREFRGRFDFNWELTVEFSGAGNGWQAISPVEENPQSKLRYPRIAPDDGYGQSQMHLACSRAVKKMWETNSTLATNYFFRVRTQYGEDQQIKSAHYGKLLGPIMVNVARHENSEIEFHLLSKPNLPRSEPGI